MAKVTQAGELTPAQKIRAQAKEATRRALLEAGLAETIARGGEIPSVDAVVARAGFTRGAFYFYFEDRAQFVGAMLEWVITDILQLLLRTGGEGVADVREVVTRFTEAITRGEWPDVGNDIRIAYLAVLRYLPTQAKVRKRHSDLMTGVIDELSDLVRDGQRSGTLRKDVDPHHVATILVLTAVGGIVWDRDGMPQSGTAIGESLIKLIEPPTIARAGAKTPSRRQPSRRRA